MDGIPVTKKTPHILSIKDWAYDDLEDFFLRVKSLERIGQETNLRRCANRLMLALILQPSLRTHKSFNIAARRLGMQIEDSDAKNFSDQHKGEDPDHTIFILGLYKPDLIVMRHPETGGVARLANFLDERGCNVPVINAGDGMGEHPTQALLDLYTMREEVGWNTPMKGLPIVFGGDLQGRAVRSCMYGVAEYGVEIIPVSHPDLDILQKDRAYLESKGVRVHQSQSIERAFKEARIVYWTRTQKEQRSEAQNVMLSDNELRQFQIRLEHLKNRDAKTLKVMHPLPIERFRNGPNGKKIPVEVSEIHPEVDYTPWAHYWKQAENGVPVRMTCIARCLGNL